MEISENLQKNILILVGVVVLVLAIVLLNKADSNLEVLSGDNIRIIYTDLGFSPEVVAITKGSTVTFVNNSSRDFWPASNLHPTHEIYPEFDSLEGIPSNGEWSFRFNKEGRFEYHDHLASNFDGVIIVVKEGLAEIRNTGLNCEDIQNIDDSRKAACLEERIREVSSNEGIAAALNVVAKGFQNDPVFVANCHALVHVIGEEAYDRFSAGKDFDADEKTVYCGYGFYHGFMERLLTLENDLNKAKEFCTYLDEEVMDGRGNAQLACFHGIGHGFVDGSEKKAWGDEVALTEPALKLCDKVVSTDEEGFRCYSGVFNSLSIAYASNLYGLTLDKEDPLWICREQKEERYKLGCYTDMMVALMVLEDDDLAKATKYLDVVEEKYLNKTASTLASLAVRQNLDVDDFSPIVNVCHSIDSNIRLDCIKGFSSGLMEFGEPEREYIKASNFCGEESMTLSEKKECFESIIDYASFTYPKDRLAKACAMIKDEFRSERVNNHCPI